MFSHHSRAIITPIPPCVYLLGVVCVSAPGPVLVYMFTQTSHYLIVLRYYYNWICWICGLL